MLVQLIYLLIKLSCVEEMKKNIHPDYHEIEVILTNGTSVKTRSTYGKKGDQIKLDVDYLTHPAWTGASSFLNQNAKGVASFNSKFGALSSIFGGSSSKPEESEDK
jgi:large subunit ribosomal protein L31